MSTNEIIIATYRRMSAEDRATFDRWLKANVVIGSIFAGAFLAMAVIGSDAVGPRQAIAQNAAGEVIGSAGASEQNPSPYELMSRLRPGQIPVEQVDEPF